MTHWREENGSLLIVALWSLMLIGLLAMGVSHRARFGLKLTEYQWDEIRLTQGAKAAVAQCVGLLSERDSSVTALNQPWNMDLNFFKDHPIPNGLFTVQRAMADFSGVNSVRPGLEDEESKLNLNEASIDELKRVFNDAPDCTAPIQSGHLRSIPELLVIKGMTAETYQRIRSLITVYGSGRVNINTAGRETFEFMGMKQPLIGKLFRFRSGRDGVIGTADDGIFKNLAGIAGELAGQAVLSEDDKISLGELIRRDRLTVRSTVFSGDCIVRLHDSRAVRGYHLVFEAEGGKINFWQEES